MHRYYIDGYWNLSDALLHYDKIFLLTRPCKYSVIFLDPRVLSEILSRKTYEIIIRMSTHNK